MPAERGQEMIGHVFGRWRVLRENGRRHRQIVWRCICECGTEKDVPAYFLRNGDSQSCGCLMRERNASRGTHGKSKRGQRTGEYRSWCSMKRRCRNKNSPDYPRYGGRGIDYCQQWESFENFLADMGPRPHGKSLDRINNDLGYFPGNCKWSTHKEQQNNRRPYSEWAPTRGKSRVTSPGDTSKTISDLVGS